MNSIELTAPAKVNLILKVLNKRKDSYHNLFTIFERISLHDKIKISKASKGVVVTCDKVVTRKPQDNIAYKAAELILKTAKVNAGVKIHIKKRIPIAAGLGGGSSDAAAVLVGIDKLFELNTGKGKLMRLGAKLGADVPFFIFNEPFAIGRGIGDKLEKLDLRTKLHHLLIYPGFKVATKDVYGSIGSNLNMQKSLKVNGLKCLTQYRGGARMALPGGWSGLERLLHNDLEAFAVAKRPAIGKVIECLASSLDRKAMVSGSGPSVFCLCPTRREAMEGKKRLLESVPESLSRRWQMFVVETD